MRCSIPTCPAVAPGEQRQKALVGTGRGPATSRSAAASSAARREKIAHSLKEIETRQKEANKLTLEKRIAQAGLDWDKRKFYIVSVICGSSPRWCSSRATSNPIGGRLGLFVGAFGLPRWMLALPAQAAHEAASSTSCRTPWTSSSAASAPACRSATACA